MGYYTELKDKVVLITGGTQGIGEAMTDAFTEEGAKVSVNGRVLNEKVKKVIDRTGAWPSMGDISKPEDAIRIVEDTIKHFGALDVLVANAAGVTMIPFLEEEEHSWWNQIDINLSGHITCMQAAIKHMKKNGGGTIIIISSFFGTLGWKDASGYGASKTGLLALGQYISREYKKYNIRAEIIVPGCIDTDQLRVDAENLGISLEEMHAIYSGEIAMGRIGTPREVAELALFMSTATGGRALNGRHLQVTGGEYRTTPAYVW